MCNGFFSGIKDAIGGAVNGFLTTGDPVGAVIGGVTGLIGNASAKKEAQRNRDYQTYMSNTSYQRMMEDLKLAGLNPMLVMNNGGASTPQGSVAQLTNLGPSMLSSSGARRMAKLAEKSYDKDIEMKDANIRNIESQTLVNSAQAQKLQDDNSIFYLRKEAQEISNILASENVLTGRFKRMWLEADTDKKREEILTEAIKRAHMRANERKILLEGDNLTYINTMLKINSEAWENSKFGKNLMFGINVGRNLLGAGQQVMDILNPIKSSNSYNYYGDYYKTNYSR